MEEPASDAATAVLTELQAVLEQACGALQAQEEGRVQDAVQVGAHSAAPKRMVWVRTGHKTPGCTFQPSCAKHPSMRAAGMQA